MDNEIMPTTFDNPWNPFTQPDEWLAFDHNNGYNTYEGVARLLLNTDGMTDDEEQAEYDRVIKQYVKLNPLLYRLVTKDSKIEPHNIKNED